MDRIMTVTAIGITTVTGLAPMISLNFTNHTRKYTTTTFFFYFSLLLRFFFIPRSGDIPFLEYTQYHVSLFYWTLEKQLEIRIRGRQRQQRVDNDA